MKDYKTVIFDLDGTLLDTSKGIFNCVRYAEDKMSLTKISDEELKKFVGPPPTESYKKIYSLSDEDAVRATKFHREYAKNNCTVQAEHYDGMTELLSDLKQKGKKLAVATLKREDIAKSMLNYFKLDIYFDTIVGIDNNESLTKKDTVNIALENINAVSDGAVLIGDSPYDAIGAKEAGVDFIGVTYGFGFADKDEVNKYDNVFIADTVYEIKKFLI